MGRKPDEGENATTAEPASRFYSSVLDLFPDPSLLLDTTGRIQVASDRASFLLGGLESELAGVGLRTFIDPSHAPDFDHALASALADGGSPSPKVANLPVQRLDGSSLPVAIALRRHLIDEQRVIVCVIRDATEEHRERALTEARDRILALIASGASIDVVLRHLVLHVEDAADKMRASVLLLDDDGLHLRHGAAPSLPDAYNRAIDGVRIGPDVGSCGTAAYLKETVIASDTLTDPRWADFRDLVRTHGLRACWSTPIRAANGDVLGTFAMYYPEPREPTGYDLEVVRGATNIAGIAIEIARMHQQLRDAYERERETASRLRELDEIKNAFLEAVSHELRTPLTSILGFAETLARQDPRLSNDARSEIQGRLVANARKLDRLLSNLLDLDRISRGMLEPRRIRVDVAGLARVVASAWDGEGHEITVEPHQPVQANVDPSQVERMLENLLINAVRYTPVGSRVRICVTDARSGVLIGVDDNGPGIPDRLKAAVFEPYKRGEGAVAAGGTGIGLSLVARFAELHGGRAWVEDAPGGGAKFMVSLPGPANPG